MGDPPLDTSRPDEGGRWWERLAPWGIVVAAHVVGAVSRIGVIAWRGGVVEDELLSWDALWYMHIAEHGYGTPRPGHSEDPLGFFPLFPGLIELVHLVTGLGYRGSALVAGSVGGLAATVMVFALIRALTDQRTGLVAATLFTTQPLAVSLSMGYSEGLFVALAAAALLAARRQDWLLAGLFGMFAGLTRITGVAVAAAVGVAAGSALWQERQRVSHAALGCVLACAGAPGYVLWVGVRRGDLGAYGRLQEEGWSAQWDWGAATWRFLHDTFRDGDAWFPISVAVLVVATVVVTAVAVWERPWPPLAVYGVVVLAFALGQSNSFQGKPRYVVPVLLVLLPVAGAIARAPRARALAAVGLLAALGSWYSAYVLVGWDYAI